MSAPSLIAPVLSEDTKDMAVEALSRFIAATVGLTRGAPGEFEKLPPAARHAMRELASGYATIVRRADSEAANSGPLYDVVDISRSVDRDGWKAVVVPRPRKHEVFLSSHVVGLEVDLGVFAGSLDEIAYQMAQGGFGR